MARAVEADYLVVGAGASGMAFTDALIDHADGRVAIVDRREGAGGHWLAAYPFVRLHQASAFYGVASTLLGGGRIQDEGPEAGLGERADKPSICAYYDEVLANRMLASERVEFFAGCEYVGDGAFVSLDSGERFEVPETCRVVDAHYVAPDIPSESPPNFGVADDVRVIPPNDLVRTEETASEYVIVGSGKTATDSIIWLLARGVDPDAICWVRPRDPWMLNRALIQPDPAIIFGMVADVMHAAGESASLEDMFLRLEDAGILFRLDHSVFPTMARTPTLAMWELEQLRTVENVVRRGHIYTVSRGRIDFGDGSVAVAEDALVVNCTAQGIKMRPLVDIWGPEAITLQPIRAGFPCFGAALAGYVEATRDNDDEKNRLCPPSPLPNTLVDWARMQAVGMRNSMSFNSEPDIKAWGDGVPLNPARVPPDYPGSPELDDAMDRLQKHAPTGLARMEELSSRWLPDPRPEGSRAASYVWGRLPSGCVGGC